MRASPQNETIATALAKRWLDARGLQAKPGKSVRANFSAAQQFFYRFWAFCFLSVTAGCDASAFYQAALMKYGHQNLYICSPSGFGQQSHCTLKV
ncbi:hypothetical protein [Mesorhizobium sangaii]|uniref:Uncharacterized protein n=1 Tax=Mesorhizobium sangaii TaxID=505389 RepID=A0A841PAR4_9HYPH|nr:hypothetical protein [Mesorhizobium sangaii]MBB6408000.1 hypothetical protein [Mesorhizobium sangaii]